MIQVSVSPGTLVAGRPAVLTVELSNTGEDACSDVVFRLRLPPGVALVMGQERVNVDLIPARQAHTYQVTVLPSSAGDAKLSTSNFSYRDGDGVTRRPSDWQVTLSVKPAGSPGFVSGDGGLAGPSRPVASPSLQVWSDQDRLAHGEWDLLQVYLRNTSGFPLIDVSLTVDGPFRVDPRSVSSQLLRDGDISRAVFNVYVPGRGKVPVRVHADFRYRDERGRVVPGAHDDRWHVEVAAVAETAQAPRSAGPVSRPAVVRTILYLVAQPTDTPLLKTYQEMREVEKELQLGRDREGFRLEHQVAVQLNDIGRALGYYQPQIVNFAGHGRPDGSLAVEDVDGQAMHLNPDGLASLLGGFSSSVQCVILNACYSQFLGRALNAKIEYVVGMQSKILDRASVQFSVGFYQGLFAGKSVPDAFQQGRDMVLANPRTSSAYEVPVLLTRH